LSVPSGTKLEDTPGIAKVDSHLTMKTIKHNP